LIVRVQSNGKRSNDRKQRDSCETALLTQKTKLTQIDVHINVASVGRRDFVISQLAAGKPTGQEPIRDLQEGCQSPKQSMQRDGFRLV
jgi:hypothetical protein